jgi:hypothetical protein
MLLSLLERTENSATNAAEFGVLEPYSSFFYILELSNMIRDEGYSLYGRLEL